MHYDCRVPNLRIEQAGDDVLLAIKVVTGGSRDEIRGMVGARLKVRTSAPPEDGKANRAVCALLARVLGIKKSRVTIESGFTSAPKTIRIEGVSAESMAAGLETETRG